ncbi:hypothetical protein [Lactiplantibacillus mudanjiangensis]|uniref:Uncharacterized protein n=1 Tax=Lactiplantibacillus mudanjiangensis TaxID=1296538 RepID=A0A660E4L2_9LACO|nr:hypothetical protein [Lactiplantibacillus mudanjiangensis]VDG26012.1 hypothetical protein MUDAN_IGPPGNFN_03539 [Lactiplantibacillus mudanjiangensis]VDG27890.1 hypothetical protein MUDAN_MDHGFNIF_02707 [Lactiplantibacillus mudanjiangensis]
MNELSQVEKDYNKWWMSRFDNVHYKIITLFNHGEIVKTYTTANGRYSDLEDAESALWSATYLGVTVTSVGVDGIRFKILNGKLRRIAN